MIYIIGYLVGFATFLIIGSVINYSSLNSKDRDCSADISLDIFLFSFFWPLFVPLGVIYLITQLPMFMAVTFEFLFRSKKWKWLDIFSNVKSLRWLLVDSQDIDLGSLGAVGRIIPQKKCITMDGSSALAVMIFGTSRIKCIAGSVRPLESFV